MAPEPLVAPLQTERLLLRPSTPDDAIVFRVLWSERDPRVPPHRRIGADGRPTVDDIAAQIEARETLSGPKLLTVQRSDRDEVIGYCGLNACENGPLDEAELAYELRQSAQGRGFATEAARAVVAQAQIAGYRRLWAGVWDWNVGSRRVLHKLGFTETTRIEKESEHGQSLLTVLDLAAREPYDRPGLNDQSAGGPRPE